MPTKTKPETASNLRKRAQKARELAAKFPQETADYKKLMKAAEKRERKAARLEAS